MGPMWRVYEGVETSRELVRSAAEPMQTPTHGDGINKKAQPSTTERKCPSMSATSAEDISGRFGVGIPGCNSVRKVSLQRVHLLPGGFCLLGRQLCLLNGHHSPYRLLIFPLAQSRVRLGHGSFSVSHLRHVENRAGRWLRGGLSVCSGRSLGGRRVCISG